MAAMRRIPIPPGGWPGGIPGGRLFRTPGGVVPARRPGLGALGGGSHRAPDFPGDPENPVWPYGEQETWGPGGLPSVPPIVGIPPVAPGSSSIPGFLPDLTPYAKSDPAATGWKWTNPTTASSVPILASTPSNTPVLSLNYQRNLLVIQNNSTATSPDTTPVFYIGFNAPVPSAGFGLGLVAGVGITFDIICPRDSIFILQSGGGGASLVVAGVVVQGTFSPT
jgi:hypothetical protein